MKVQAPKPKYLCEHVDYRVYARRGMQVIGNLRERAEHIGTGMQLSSLADGWHPGAILSKGVRCLYLGLRWTERHLWIPRFKLPKSNVIEVKDLPAELMV